MKKGLIITDGPACHGREESLLSFPTVVGVRINTAHEENLHERIERWREAAEKLGKKIIILVDLGGGRKLRIDELSTPKKIGPNVILTTRPQGRLFELPLKLSAACSLKAVPISSRLYIKDGRFELEVVAASDDDLECVVLRGEGVEIVGGEGLNIPSHCFPLPLLTPEDIEVLKICLEEKVDWIGISFVRTAQDVLEVQQLIKKLNPGWQPKLVAKLETRPAIENLNEIIEVADIVMIARGDLPLETSFQEMPELQQEITSKCRLAGRPVIIATRLYTSMEGAPSPTFHERIDAFYAALNADFLCPSNPTAIGAYPIEVVQQLDRDIKQAQAFLGRMRQCSAA